ncbi:unnamed protein product [Heligmosomoides polygyrus]|uniref:Protein HID1 n=1 Tax=Heligmosomoides polygyrus TaxID=6339 RepID=A0A3P7WVH4_HELPZ|nr:unnamed protein product [Heligmosomoides polygyrus]
MPLEVDEASELCISIQQLIQSRHETDVVDINYVQPLVQNFENAISLCVSWMCDLALRVYAKYRLPPLDVPSFICLSPALREEQITSPPSAVGNAFLAFFCLRLGDLFRYKLLPAPDSAVERVGPQLTNRKLLVAPLSLLQPLGNALDEQRARHSLTLLLTLAFNKITDLLLSDAYLRPDLLLCIVLLLRVPSVCRPDPGLIAILSQSQQDVIFDNEKVETFSGIKSSPGKHAPGFDPVWNQGFTYLRCFCESDPFEYPVSYGQIADHLAELAGDSDSAKTPTQSEC